jgi:phosphotransferase system  glucose/maltose/N-acetylglucosamine-specific IIC component
MATIKALFIAILVTAGVLGAIFLTPLLMVIAGFVFTFLAIRHEIKYPEDEDDQPPTNQS